MRDQEEELIPEQLWERFDGICREQDVRRQGTHQLAQLRLLCGPVSSPPTAPYWMAIVESLPSRITGPHILPHKMIPLHMGVCDTSAQLSSAPPKFST